MIYHTASNSVDRFTPYVWTLVKYQVFNAIFRLHIFDLTRKHHLIRFADLSHNIYERVVIEFSRHIKPF